MSNDFNKSEILNEISRLFRARLDVGKEGGTFNTQEEYEQLLELASFTFLVNPTAIFYLAKIVAIRLTGKVRTELRIAEDILVLLENLSNPGEASRDPSDLFNARNALLALDAAAQKTGRPESKNFRRSMRRYAESLRRNIQDRRTGVLTRPREEARELIRTNLAQLKTTHASLLDTAEGLRDLLDDFITLNLSEKVAATTFTRIRDRIDQLISITEDASNIDNISASRQSLLSILASQAAVDMVSEFRDPRGLKFRSPIRPIPSTTTHLGEVIGDGTPASVVTNSGPWTFPISGPIEISVDGGAAQEVSLEKLTNPTVGGEADGPFNIKPGHQNLHIIVDPETYKLTAVTAGSSSTHVVIQNPALVEDRFTWGFKHLGNTVLFRNAVIGGAGQITDTYPRIITEFRVLTTVDILGFDSDTGILTLSAGSFSTDHIGAYLKIGTARYEILDVITTTTAITETRGQIDPAGSGIEIRGQLSTDGDIQFDFVPALVFGNPQNGDAVEIGPCMKTFQTPTTGAITAAALVAEINSHPAKGDLDALHAYGGLKDHVKASLAPNNPSRVALAPRTRLNSYMKVVSLFPKPILTGPGPIEVLEGSFNDRVGISVGATIETSFDSNNLLSPDELSDVILDNTQNLDVEVEEVVIYAGSRLQKFEGSKNVSDLSGINFETLGVREGDIVQLLSGTEPGSFQVEQVQALNLTLVRAQNFLSSQQSIQYRIVRSRVRFSSRTAGPGSSIQITAPEELGVSENTQYGAIRNFRAVDSQGATLSFSGVTPGDLLRIVGEVPEHTVVRNYGSQLLLETGLPSNVSGAGFEIRGGGSKKYAHLQLQLKEFLSSSSLFAKNNFNENVDAVDAALTSAVLPGQSFAASKNRAQRVVSELVVRLSSNRRRADEYTLTTTPVSTTLEQLAMAYSAPRVHALDRLIDAFEDRKYNRAADLLKSGRFVLFFDTTEETGSYSGAVLAASKTVNQDLPAVSTAQQDVDEAQDTAVGILDVPDADIEFDDIEGEYEIDE